ncbi:MAG: ComEC family competence protein [Alphaproteobacteria bacterium]|nr:MAG: ComEC family competence protein [Alphaproteobacteria bacterium]
MPKNCVNITVFPHVKSYSDALRTPRSWQTISTSAPLWLAFGIAFYYATAWAIPWGIAFALLGLSLWWVQGGYIARGQWGIMVGLLCVGASLAHHEIYDSPHHAPLSRHYRHVLLEGTVDEIAYADGKIRVLLNDVTSTALQRGDQHTRIRITIRTHRTIPREGDRISVRATIFPPSRPALPNGFDFGQFFYARMIDGVGYATSTISIITEAPPAPWYAMTPWRTRINAAIMQRLPQPEAGVTATLITGERLLITKEVQRSMSVSGLAHILAISGMHMVMISGSVFFLLRYAIACIPYLALRIPIIPIAAFFACLCGAGYMMLAGAPVPAIRAFIMIGFVFFAIIVQRESHSIRAWVLAATGMLLYSPALLFDISFQLSFMAVLALMLTYRRMRPWHHKVRATMPSLVSMVVLYVTELMISSFVAMLATTPIIMHHFNQLTPYTILANLLALPLMSFFIVPMCALTLILMPFGLAHYGLDGIGLGMHWLIAIAQWVEGFEHAALYVPTMSAWCLALTLTGVVLLLQTTQRRTAIIALILIILPMLEGTLHTPPDLLIAEDGWAIAVREDNQQWRLLRGTLRNFHVEQWQTRLGGRWITQRDDPSDLWTCSKTGCDGLWHQQRIRLRFDYKDKAPLCLPDSDIVISSFYSDRWRCASPHALRIDRSALEVQGAHALWLPTGRAPRLWYACLEGNHWPWMRCHKRITNIALQQK